MLLTRKDCEMNGLVFAVSLLPFGLCVAEYTFTPSPPECSTVGQLTAKSNQQVDLKCLGLVIGHNIYWSISENPSDERRIGVCTQCSAYDHCGPCDSGGSPNFSLTRTSSDSTLSFKASEQLNGATFRCSTFNNDSAVTCRLHVVSDFTFSFPDCENQTMTIWENQQTSITCAGLTHKQKIYWSLQPSPSPGGTQKKLGICEICPNLPCGSCSDLLEGYSMSRNPTNTTVEFLADHGTHHGAQVTCSRFNNNTAATCKLSVIQDPFKVESTEVTLHNNFTVKGSVTFSHLYASDDNITCLWYMTRDDTQTQRLPLGEVHLDMRKEETGDLFAGKCVIMTSLNTSEGRYNFSVEVLPRRRPEHAGSETIKKPGTLRTETLSCPRTIEEGQNVTCKCRYLAAQQPSPRASSITWVNTSSSSAKLDLHNVSRQEDGLVYLCRSRWGPREKEIVQETTYTLSVVYGPVKVRISATGQPFDDLHPLTLTCRVQDVFPSANFTWNVDCWKSSSTSVNSTCTLRPDELKGSKKVRCAAKNSNNAMLRATASYALASPEDQEGEGTDGTPLGAIVGAIAVVILLAVIVIVVIIIIVRRRNRTKESSTKAKTEADAIGQDDFVEYINDFYGSTDDLEVSGSAHPTSAPQSVSAAAPSNSPSTSPSTPTGTTSNHKLADNVTSGEGDTEENAAESENSTFGVSEVGPSTGEVYAQVQKKKKKANQDTDTEPKAGQSPADQAEGELYAQVQKKTKKGKGKAGPRQGSEDSKQQQPLQEADKSCPSGDATEYHNCPSTGDNSAELYMNVDLFSSTPGEDNDEYHNLQFHRPTADEHNPLYSHLNDL